MLCLQVKCIRSGHEMPCQLSAILQYINGKKYKKAAAEPQFEMEKYKEIILPSNKPGHEHQLFCTLTLRHMNNQPLHIEQHINGRRFQRAYKRWLRCQETGEKFCPAVERRKKKEDSAADPEEKDNDKTTENIRDDDLSDLYPVEDFGALELSTEDEVDSETEANTSDHKRKAEDDVSYQMKRCSDQKNTKCSGKTKRKRMKHCD